MLIIGRRPGQSINVHDTDTGEIVMTIHVNRIERGQTQIGINADRKFKILREELEARTPSRQRAQ